MAHGVAAPAHTLDCIVATSCDGRSTWTQLPLALVRVHANCAHADYHASKGRLTHLQTCTGNSFPCPVATSTPATSCWSMPTASASPNIAEPIGEYLSSRSGSYAFLQGFHLKGSRGHHHRCSPPRAAPIFTVLLGAVIDQTRSILGFPLNLPLVD